MSRKKSKTLGILRIELGVTALILAVLIPVFAYRPHNYQITILGESSGYVMLDIGRGELLLKIHERWYIDRPPKNAARFRSQFRSNPYVLRIPWIGKFEIHDYDVTTTDTEGARSLKPMPIHLYSVRTEPAVPAIFLGVFAFALLVPGPVRTFVRRRKGLCLNCGYDLTGNVTGVCSECGERIEHSMCQQQNIDPSRDREGADFFDPE